MAAISTFDRMTNTTADIRVYYACVTSILFPLHIVKDNELIETEASVGLVATIWDVKLEKALILFVYLVSDFLHSAMISESGRDWYVQK